MEKGFDAGWGSDSKLNKFFFLYERNVLTSHLISLNHKRSGLHNIQNIEGSQKASQNLGIDAFENNNKINQSNIDNLDEHSN